MLNGINWIAVIVATVLMYALGYAWYGPLFGDAWTAALGHAPTMNGSMGMIYGLGFLNTLITAVGLAWLTSRIGTGSLASCVAVSVAAWFFFDFTTMAVDYLYVGHSLALTEINAGYQLASYVLTGVVLGLFHRKPAVRAEAAA